MNTKVARIICAVLMLVFVNFMFSNAVFIHSHHLSGGRVVTHTHPNLPTSHHTHTSQSIDLISVFNLAASSTETVCNPPVFTAPQCYTVIESHYDLSVSGARALAARLRGPPMG